VPVISGPNASTMMIGASLFENPALISATPGMPVPA